MNYPKISTIILNWNGLNDTIECIKSVKAIDYPNYEMIVVDNGSTDNSEKVLREKFPTTTLIQNGDDLGYAEGNNRGIYYALNRGAEYILILNNDTKLEKSCLSELIVVANDNPEMGILGPIAYDYFEQDKLLATNYYFDWNKLKTRSSVMPTSDLELGPSFWESDIVRGDCLLIKKEVFIKSGFFDSRFFLYMEESDFCYRARRAGFKLAIVKKAKYFRKSGTSLGGNVPAFFYYMSRNNLFFFFKNATPEQKKWWPVKYLKAIKWEIFGYHLPKYFATKNPIHLKNIIAVLSGYRDYFLGRFGPIQTKQSKHFNRNFLLIAHTFPPKVGGIEQFYGKLAQHFRDRATIIAPKADSESPEIDNESNIFRRKIVFKEPKNKLAKYAVLLLERIKLILISLSVIRKKRSKIVVLGSIWLGWLGYFLKRFIGLKYFIFAHGTDFLRLKKLFLSEKHKRYLNGAEKIIVNSNFTKQLAIECEIGEQKLEIVHPGCDLPEQTENNNNGKAPMLLGVGRLAKRKGFDRVIKALPIVLEKYPRLHYYIAGDGEQRDYLESLVESLKLENNVIFTGRVSNEKLSELYQGCDIFILTNYIDEQALDVEGFGMVFVEANSFGKPVIGGRNGGALDAIVEGETGLLVDPDNEKEIAEKIIYLLDNHAVRMEMGRKGRERVEKELNWAMTFSKIEKILGI